MFADREKEVESHVTCVMIRGLGHRRSVMLKSYFVEHILQTLLKYVFKKWIYVVKRITSKLHPSLDQFVSYPK